MNFVPHRDFVSLIRPVCEWRTRGKVAHVLWGSYRTHKHTMWEQMHSILVLNLVVHNTEWHKKNGNFWKTQQKLKKSKEKMYWQKLNHYNLPFNRLKLNSVALVRERTIPTEQPPPVGEVSANFSGWRGVTWSAQRVPTVVNLCFLDRSRYLFIQVAPQLTSRGWVDPVRDPLLLRKSGSAGNRTRDLYL